VDAWGNLYQKNPCNGVICPSKTYSDSLTVSVSNNKNQLDSYAYDANGNLTNDQLGHTFAYDAENRPRGGGGANYYYDGEGERVAKSNGTLYWFGTNSSPLVETDLSGNLVEEYIFANGKRTAMRNVNNGYDFYFADQVGSAQLVTGPNGGIQQQIEYHPYGEERVITNSITQNYRFTGKEHDSETNDDYFGARYYGSWSGRFLTPDWAATPVPIPYAVMGNPQTLNLYSYVENNPITGTDPDGHCEPFCGALVGAGVGAGAVILSEVFHGESVFSKDSFKRIVGGAVGGAIVGGTLGAASEAGLPLLQQAIAGAGANIVGGVADRAISTGSMNTATDSLSDIRNDAVFGAAGVGLEHGIARTVEKAGSKELTQTVKEMNRKGSIKGKAKAAAKVEAAKAEVTKKAEAAAKGGEVVAEVTQKLNERSPPEQKPEGPISNPDPNQRH
jgi:RHS repeat-associated protein